MTSDDDAKSDAESDRGNVEVIEDEDEEEEPTEDEVREYAEYLGIDPDAEPHLMWIARKGVGAPIPKPWKACKEGDEVFYYNFDTNESMWDHPLDAKFRSLAEKHRKAGPGGLPEKTSEGEEGENSEVSEDIPSATSTPGSTPASASGGQRICLEKGGEVAGGPTSTSAMGTSPTGAAADLDLANESQSFLSEVVESDDLEEQQTVSQARTSPSGALKTPSSSFVSELVDKSDLEAAAEDSGLAASPTAAHVAEEMAGKRPAQVTKEVVDDAASTAPLPSPAAVAPMSMQDAAALWSAGAGGTAMSTPRSPPSSRSRSSSPGGGGPVSVSSSASAADATNPAKAPVSAVVTPSEVNETGSPAVGPGGGKLLLTFKKGADMIDVMRKVKALAMVTSTELLDGAEVGLVDVSDVSSAELAMQHIEGVASIEIDQEVSISRSGKPVVDRISPEPLDVQVLRKSPDGSPSSGDRPPPVLDNLAHGHSARSSNPSEVSEDFRSDWMSPPVTARSASGNAAQGAEGHSLEVSASMDGRSIDTEGAGRSAGTRSLSRSPPDARSPSLASAPTPQLRSKRTWAQLHRELQVLAKALGNCELIRSKQREYLKLLNIDCLKAD